MLWMSVLACWMISIPMMNTGRISRKVMPMSITPAAAGERPCRRSRTRVKMPKVTVTMMAPRMMAVRNGQMIFSAA